MIKAGIIGGAGYTAGELIRLLLNHPETEIVFINSSSNAGNRITDVHEGLYGETDLRFTDQLPLDAIDVLFFCTAHGERCVQSAAECHHYFFLLFFHSAVYIKCYFFLVLFLCSVGLSDRTAWLCRCRTYGF